MSKIIAYPVHLVGEGWYVSFGSPLGDERNTWDVASEQDAHRLADMVNVAHRGVMPPQTDGKTVLRIAIDRGEGTPEGRCGECEKLECNGERYCEEFYERLEGKRGHFLRRPACRAAEAAHDALV